ncbi:MAG: cytochrome c biogenesis protein CcsA [Candidatus Thalassarchaeaceae archaeon]|nr:cytochrome c biogenesis protein CcsA [Candidatus Thalassarchaeaceae archaeon]MDP7091602.1 cytochrome c biogenesis protein CcsA [Candidatus Thalassarchaeaceae archaeon]MDP7257722.1 cytochrome c biogenesis protein CcsA [Candidatus Thalassarchaeaceae archaeon]MDP7445604.1 cytochrome c biogenesis protein CcsA [Candidatus Thalassarchaeaceae archaeon]MDP7648813.1 cytochrome c biogenesis protein CcsA [Candidatus Thalassarchaeaceae archaeon]
MLSLLGQALMVLAVLTSLHQIMRPDRGGDQMVRYVTMACQSAPFALLVAAFLIEATTLDLVSRYGGDGLPLLYRISAVWGSRSGPLLMWAAILAVVTWLMAGDSDPIPLEVRLMHGWTALLLALSLLLEPFAGSESAERGELNPLLQTDLMVIHPPVVFVYYALCLATASIALAGVLRSDRARDIHAAQLHWARSAFLFGTIGIGLGGLWAYAVLDWGGYWAWDPVETGSLLPWLALLVIVHARARPDSQSAFSASPAMGLIAGALALHATLVTRANGVWSSVHAFVAEDGGALPQDPYLRVLQIADLSPVGIEISTYLISLLLLGGFAVLHLHREQALGLAERGRASLLEVNRGMATALLIAFAAVGLWIGSTAVLTVGLALMLLLVSGDAEDPPTHWVAAGVMLMLFASWGWVAEIQQAIAGMAPFLAVWLISDDDDDLSAFALPFTDESVRSRLARAVPWYGGATYLLLTWLLLTVEIDGTNLAAHEFYGAPLIGLLAIGLALYAWGRTLPARRGSILVAAALAASIALAALSESFDLPGDPHLDVTSGITRGALSLFLLSWLVFALPSTAQHLWSTANRTLPRLRSDGLRAPSNAARARLLGSHIAHLGILLLLIGHVMTTTLVDRSDPSHLVTLEKDQPIEHRGYEFVFTDVEVIPAEDDAYPYSIGDGYLGVAIEVREDGQRVAGLMPGMLRFDSPSGSVSARSEVDRMVGLTGDTIVILDVFQSNDLLSSMIRGQTSDIDSVRVTVHHLPGSHLVWAGWALVMLGGLLPLSSASPVGCENEE